MRWRREAEETQGVEVEVEEAGVEEAVEVVD